MDFKESYVKQSGQGMTVKLTDFAFQPELDPGWREVPCTDEKVGAMQCKLKEKWILSSAWKSRRQMRE